MLSCGVYNNVWIFTHSNCSCLWLALYGMCPRAIWINKLETMRWSIREQRHALARVRPSSAETHRKEVYWKSCHDLEMPQKYKWAFSCGLTLPSENIPQISYHTILLQKFCWAITLKHWIMILSKGKSLLEGMCRVIQRSVILQIMAVGIDSQEQNIYLGLTNEPLFPGMMEYF